MSSRQHMMALGLAAILLAVVLATAAKPQNPSTAAQVDMWIEPPAPEVLRLPDANMTSRVKSSAQQTPPVPAYEITSTRDQGAAWDRSPAYDLARIGQTSIYVFYTPNTSK